MGSWFSKKREKRKFLQAVDKPKNKDNIIEDVPDPLYVNSDKLDIPKNKDNIIEEVVDIEIEDVSDPLYVNSDQLVEDGNIYELMEAITNNVELRGKWQPVNYAAKCGQYDMVNWLMMTENTDLRVI